MSEAHLPPVKERQKMLEAGIAEMRRTGYNATINLTIAEVQSGAGAEAQKRDCRETIDNARKAVARLQKMLDELPADETETE